MDWIAEVERIDRMLHSRHVPANVRVPAVAMIMQILVDADKEKRERQQLVWEAVQRCGGNVRKAASEEGWSHETFYAAMRCKLSKDPVTN